MRKISLLCALLLTGWCTLLAQSRQISGRVTNEKDEPLPGSSVRAKGSSSGTVTDSTGMFRLTVDDKIKTLVISSLGYGEKEVALNSQDFFTVKLLQQDAGLDEVVVVGYQQIARANLTGSVAKVAGKEIANRPVMSFDQALTGKAAGVQVNTSPDW